MNDHSRAAGEGRQTAVFVSGRVRIAVRRAVM